MGQFWVNGSKNWVFVSPSGIFQAVFLCLFPQEHIGDTLRCKERGRGIIPALFLRGVAKNAIGWEYSTTSLREAFRLPYCDTAEFYDNDNGFRLVAEYRNGELLILGENPPQWVHELRDYLKSK